MASVVEEKTKTPAYVGSRYCWVPGSGRVSSHGQVTADVSQERKSLGTVALSEESCGDITRPPHLPLQTGRAP